MKIYYKFLSGKLLLIVLFGVFTLSSYAQINPTLGVGLEQLTLNKGTIDVAVLTEIIMEKQKELKKEALKRFMFKMFPNNNYATKYYIQNALHILLNEKNPHVIEKEILELTTNYALALGLAKVYANPGNQLAKLSDPKIIALIDSLKTGYKKDIINDMATDEKFKDNKFYGLMVDIVSHSLSNSAKIKEKGFYKYPIDYRMDDEDHKTLKKSTLNAKVVRLETSIQKQIDDYITNFEIIKEFYMRNKGKKSGEIINTLMTDYYIDLNSIVVNTTATEKFNDLPDTFKAALGKVKTNKAQITEVERKLAKIKELYTDYNNYTTQQEQLITNIGAILNVKADKITAVSLLEDKMNKLTPADSLLKQSINHAKNAFQLNDQKLKILMDDLSKNDSVFIYIKSLQPNLNSKTNTEIIEKLDLNELNTNIKNAIKILDAQNLANLQELAKEKQLFKVILKKITDTILSLDLGLDKTSESQFETTNTYVTDISAIYMQLELLSKKETITLSDIKYVEDSVLPLLIKYTLLANKDKPSFQSTVQNFKLLSGLLKVNAVTRVAGSIGEYSDTFDDILTFVSNLDKLDEAQTYQSIINLLQDNNEIIFNALKESDNERFKKTYQLFINAVKKYTVINTTENYVNIDVISFLSDLQQYYGRNETSWFSLYLTLGLSENFLFNPLKIGEKGKSISNIGFASEKIGMKFTLFRIGRFDDNKKLVANDIYLNRRNPFFNEIYALAYGSGLLYSLANTTTNENFDFPHAGFGIGLRFYNALDVNLSLGLPFIEGENFGDNGFFSIGLDIPLAEYLEKLGKK